MRRIIAMFGCALALALHAPAHAQRTLATTGGVGVPGVANEPGDVQDLGYPLRIGPIDGLTTGWHDAPASRAWVTRGTRIVLEQRAPEGAVVLWRGEGLTVRGNGGREVVCEMNELGEHRIVAEVRTGAARQIKECVFDVVEYPQDRIIQWRELSVDEAARGIEATWTNMDRVNAFFRGGVSRVHEVGEDRYAAAVDTRIRTRTFVWPRGFAPLMEVRVDGVPRALGATASLEFEEVGAYEIEVGAPGSGVRATLETYEVRITSHTEGEDIIEEDTDLVFRARTTPGGYEDLITWISATKYGSAEPMTATGPTFRVRFEDTFGPWTQGSGDWSWTGVRADNASFGVDVKTCVNFDGFQHCPLGDAALALVGGPQLEISNIDDLNGDGVRVEFSPVAGPAFVQGTRSALVPVAIAMGEAIETSMIGDLGGPTGLLGFGGIENFTGKLRVFGDFLSIGCSDVIVDVYNGGVFQGSFIRPAGPVALLNGGQLIEVGQKQGTLEYLLDVPVNVAPILPPAPALVGDEIHLSPAACSTRGVSRGSAIECFDLRVIFPPLQTRNLFFTSTFLQP